MDDGRVHRITQLRQELEAVPAVAWSGIEAWVAKATPIIRSDWPNFVSDFQTLVTEPRWTRLPRSWGGSNSEVNNARAQASEKASDQHKIGVVKQNVLHFLDGLLATAPATKAVSALDTLVFLCKRFPIFARQLAVRGRNRDPIQIADEYDVQYLVQALLRLHFSDVRAEEWTPSYAGGSSRIDFLLKSERYAVEVKKTRDTLRDAEVGTQLIIDVERYAHHPDCSVLICFVYDPESLLDNPRGLEHDLSGLRENLEVVVIVSPSVA